MKWPLLILLACAPAWASPPIFQADVPDPAAVTCLYENATAGQVEQFPVTVSTERGNSAYGYRVCLRSALDWPAGPNSVRLATRAADGRTTDYTAAVLPRPSGAVASARLLRDAAVPPPPPPPPSTTMAAYVSKGINNTSASNSLALTYPASISAGEVLFAFIQILEPGASVAGLTNNGGFTVFHDELISLDAYPYHWVLAWKRAAGGESGSVTFSWTSSTIFNEGFVFKTNGVYATGTPFEYAAGTPTTSSTHTAPSVSSTYSNSLMLYLGVESNYAAWSTVSGFTEHWDGGASQIGTVQSKALSAAGATGTAASTTGAGAGNAVTLLLFDTTPAGGGGGTTYNESISETASATDAASTAATRAGALSETVSATDVPSATAVRAGSISESASATDAIIGVAVVARSVSESASAADAASAVVLASRGVTEAASATDSPSATATRAGALTEAASASDATTNAMAAAAALSESASASDSTSAGAASYDVTIEEAASAADAATVIATRVASLSEPLSAADAYTVTTVYGAALSEPGSAADATNWSGAEYSVDLTESASLADAVSAALQALASIAEAASAGDAPTIIISAGASLAEPAAAADALATALQITALLAEPASAADTVFVQPDGTIDVGIEEAASAMDEYVAVLIDGFLVITAPPRRTLTAGASRPANLSAAYRPRNLPGRGR